MTLRTVLVGCGRISATWLKIAQQVPEIEIVGLVDLVEGAAARRAQEFGLTGARVGTDLARLLDQTQPALVFNCTAPEAHVATSLTALERGCHVLSEKPMAVSLEGALRLVAAAAEAQRLMAVTQNRRYETYVRRLRALRLSGALGPLTTLDSDHYMGNHFGGFRDEMEHPLLLDMAIHTFDAARCISGAEPVAVYCKEWNPLGSWYAHGASAVAIFEMSNGLVYTYRGSWCSEGLNTGPQAAWRLVGTQGSATWDSFETLQAEVVSQVGGFATTGKLQSNFRAVEVPPPDDEGKTGGHLALMREFVQCVRDGGQPETAAAANLPSLAMVFAAIESADTGRTVDVKW